VPGTVSVPAILVLVGNAQKADQSSAGGTRCLPRPNPLSVLLALYYIGRLLSDTRSGASSPGHQATTVTWEHPDGADVTPHGMTLTTPGHHPAPSTS